MDEAIRPEPISGLGPDHEPEPETRGLRSLPDQLNAGYAGVHALQGSTWQVPADLNWEEDDWEVEPTVERDRAESKLSFRNLAIGAGIFAIALVPRLLVIFVITDPQNPGLGWYGDTFHHWQIAYLSKEVGLAEGFLRLWDLKGLEYFWGLLHPLLLAGLFQLTGSTSIVIPRLVSAVGSSISIAMLFFLLRRHFNSKVAAAGILLAIVNPVAIFSDGVGMQEPLGLIFILGGLLLWPRRLFWVGVCFAIAGLVRAEYWIFGAGLMVVGVILEKRLERKIVLAIGWLVPSLAYAKYLLDWTGNPIYPVYWNFMGNAAGAWMVEAPFTADRIVARWLGRAVLVAAVAAAYWLIRERKNYSLFILLGIGNIIFLGFMWGISSYIHGFIPRFIYDRLLVVPYMYAGIFIAIGAFHTFAKYQGERRSQWLGWPAVAVLAVLIQVAWIPLLGYYDGIRPVWEYEKQLAAEVAAQYKGGAIAFPEDRPGLTYALVEYHGVPAEAFVSQMYDPFAYMDERPFSEWGTNRELVEDWFVEQDIQLLVYDIRRGHYEELVKREPGWFGESEAGYRNEVRIYEVDLG